LQNGFVSRLQSLPWLFFFFHVDAFDSGRVMLTELVWWQAEFLNPGGSVKDRAALYIVKARIHTCLCLDAFILIFFGFLFLMLQVGPCRSDPFTYVEVVAQDAEEKGLLKPGGVIVEGTAGNTGIGLALVGNARGYKTVIVIPKTQSQVRVNTLLLSRHCAVFFSQK
jgi:hypothetical protein